MFNIIKRSISTDTIVALFISILIATIVIALDILNIITLTN